METEADLISQMLSSGMSYTQSIEREAYPSAVYNKYRNFTLTNKKNTNMSDSNKDFVWKTKDRETNIEDMPLDFLLVAVIHSLNRANDQHARYVKFSKLAEDSHAKTDVWMDRLQILSDRIEEMYGIILPERVEHIKFIRELIQEGTYPILKNADLVEKQRIENKEKQKLEKDVSDNNEEKRTSGDLTSPEQS